MWRQHVGASLAGNVAEPLLYLLILGFGMGEMMDAGFARGDELSSLLWFRFDRFRRHDECQF